MTLHRRLFLCVLLDSIEPTDRCPSHSLWESCEALIEWLAMFGRRRLLRRRSADVLAGGAVGPVPAACAGSGRAPRRGGRRLERRTVVGGDGCGVVSLLSSPVSSASPQVTVDVADRPRRCWPSTTHFSIAFKSRRRIWSCTRSFSSVTVISSKGVFLRRGHDGLLHQLSPSQTEQFLSILSSLEQNRRCLEFLF